MTASRNLRRLGVAIVSVSSLTLVAAGTEDGLFAHDAVAGAPDTIPVIDLRDLRILDTIRPSDHLPPEAYDSSVIRLGGDTLLWNEVRAFPPYSGQPRSGLSGNLNGVGMRVDVRVYARDTSQSTLRLLPLPFAKCPVEFRLYRRSSRTGRPAWSSSAAPDSLRCPRPVVHQGVDLNLSWPVKQVLADSLRPGRYFFSTVVRLADGRALRFSNGADYLTADPTPPKHDRLALRFHVRSEVSGRGPRTLKTRMVTVNSSRRLVNLYHGSCALNVRLFKVSGSSSNPVWRSEERQPRQRANRIKSGYGCTAELRMRILAPGDSQVFVSAIPLAEVLADSLPFGRYRVVADVSLTDNGEGESIGPTYHTVMPAGDIVIAPEPDPMPQTRKIGALRYTASARIIRGNVQGSDTVRTLVLLTNTSSQPASVQVPRNCPFSVGWYRSTADRDSLPSAESVWRETRTCPWYLYRFELRPRESVTFHSDKLVREIPPGAGPGRYYLLVWIGGIPEVTLSAGSVEVHP
ncbi:MAG: hypothetical protein JWL97_2205 [Gemmatimonadales bacterium]|nr:hypothetical protein [Gemmatimonadales bacterium]